MENKVKANTIRVAYINNTKLVITLLCFSQCFESVQRGIIILTGGFILSHNMNINGGEDNKRQRQFNSVFPAICIPLIIKHIY